jgi:malonate transporter and related proteins
MTSTIITALLPIVVTMLLGYLAGWHEDFVGDQANVLTRMVLLYALPLNLFASMVGMSSTDVLRKIAGSS